MRRGRPELVDQGHEMLSPFCGIHEPDIHNPSRA
jgi:hypothetical protein